MSQKTNNVHCINGLEQQVESVLERFVRPYLHGHNGDVVIKEISGKDVGFSFRGACKSCPSAQITMQEVVETLLRNVLGDAVGRIYLINETDEELLSFAKTILNKNKKNDDGRVEKNI